MKTCSACKTTKPESDLIEVMGVFVCRDVMDCEYTSKPWKHPDLTDEERKAAREVYRVAMRAQESGE